MWWFLNHTGFPLAFSHRCGNLTILEFSSKWVKVMLLYREGGGLPVVGGGGSLMTHSAGSVTTRRKAFKYVMTSEPYRYIWYLKQGMASLPYINNYFFKTLKLKSLWVWPKFSLIHIKVLGRYAKNWIFHQNNIMQYFFSKSVHGYLTMRCVK